MFKKILSITLCSICIFMAGGAVSAQAAETTISNLRAYFAGEKLENEVTL